MQANTATLDQPTSSCFGESFRISSAALPSPGMTAARSTITPLTWAFVVTIAQIVIAVLLLAPEGPLSWRYSTLNQHDSYWFMNIIDRGYETIVPPINHKVMEVSNVAFFPAYPATAALLHKVFRIEADSALLITAQIAAFGFWSYFFLFCERWNLSPTLRSLGALSILSHPAAFFLIAGYSESMFLMGLLGFLYWSTSESRHAKVFAVLHGIIMSGTRIVGIPCAGIPVVQSILQKRLFPLRQHFSVMTMSILATFGAGAFFTYCLIRWGHWDMYMLTQSAGWGIVPDYLAIFRPSSYRWLVPALNNPVEASQLATSLTMVAFIIIAIVEIVAALRSETNWRQRIGLYAAAAIIYYISVSGVACVEMESMLRYQFCSHTLIVLAFLHFLRQLRLPPLPVRALATATVVLACATGLIVQGWYVWNFTRANWVA
jgi:hypothetical protein